MTDTSTTEHANEPGGTTASETVLVVGAGPVGLVAAIELVRQGARVRVVDRLTEPTTQSRAVLVHPRTQEHLAAMGVLPAFDTASQRQTALAIFTGRDAAGAVRVSTDGLDSRYRWMLDLPQFDSELLLGKHAAALGIVVERGVTLTALRQSDDGVDVTLESATGSEQARFGWVVGADGGHSTVRTAVGTRIEGVFEGQSFLMADVITESDLTPDTVRMFVHPEGIGGAFPMRGGRYRFLFLVEKPAAGAAPTLEQAQELINQRMGGQWTISDPTWLTYFEVHHGQIPRYRFGRVLLGGDAAHIHSPAGGQGMNTGIQDAVNLAWKLALVSTGRADPALLDSYHAERHPIGASVVKQTNAMTNVMAGSGVMTGLRAVAMFVLGHVHALAEKMVSGFAETAIGYPDSPIVAGPKHGHLLAGSHAPDVAGLTTPSGADTWIGDLLRRPGHLLLARTIDPGVLADLRVLLGDLGTVTAVVADTATAPPDAIVDLSNAIGRQYGLDDGGVVLIRPDGYVGFLSVAGDTGSLRTYLTDILGVRTGIPGRASVI